MSTKDSLQTSSNSSISEVDRITEGVETITKEDTNKEIINLYIYASDLTELFSNKQKVCPNKFVTKLIMKEIHEVTNESSVSKNTLPPNQIFP